MLIRLFDVLAGRDAVIAMLCKTGVARKALLHAWTAGISISSARLHHIDASKHFDAAVDACFLVVTFNKAPVTSTSCTVYESLSANSPPMHEIGYRDGRLVADVGLYARRGALSVGESVYRWRSGVKHDCSRVMEFVRSEDGQLRNGFGAIVDIETDLVFPMLKSSQVAREGEPGPVRWMLVTQRAPSDDTNAIERSTPRTWRYLHAYAEHLDKRGSSIYAKRGRFAVFGIGDYSFAPWKVAISGFYKKLRFRMIGPHNGKPTILDDTSYFLPCHTYEEATVLEGLLNSREAQEFFNALVFWDSKRPITADMLNQLRIERLAELLHVILPVHPADSVRPRVRFKRAATA